jgi:hypothetical protein
MRKTNEELQAMAAEVNKAWADYKRVERPAHQVRNCQADLDAETAAMWVWQAKRQAYIEAVRQAQL